MPISSQRFEGITRFLASRQLALWLFLLLCVSLIPGTLRSTDFHIGVLSRVIIAGMGLNLVLCTVQRVRTLSKPVLVMHVGAVLTLAGGVISSLGFVATANVYEGTSIDTVYRWDLEDDAPLGATLTVKKISADFYPVAVQVGVLKGQDKVGLFVLKTGKSFDLGPYTVRADSLEMPLANLKLTVSEGTRCLGTVDTEGTKNLPPDFPYDFRLVKFKNPVLKRIGIDVELSREGSVVQEGVLEANSPLEWNGLSIYNTDIDRDEYGNAYAGIQIVKDPGKPVVYAGFAVLLAGTLLWMYQKTYARR